MYQLFVIMTRGGGGRIRCCDSDVYSTILVHKNKIKLFFSVARNGVLVVIASSKKFKSVASNSRLGHFGFGMPLGESEERRCVQLCNNEGGSS